MKHKKQVTRRRAKAGKITKIAAQAGLRTGQRRLARYLPEDLAGMYRPMKKPVTLRLDADVLEWFQRHGRGYQTRINEALRKGRGEGGGKGEAVPLYFVRMLLYVQTGSETTVLKRRECEQNK